MSPGFFSHCHEHFHNNYWIYLVWNHGLISAITKALTKMCSPDTKMSVLHLSIQVQVKIIIIISPFTVLKVLLYFYFLKYIYYKFPLCADWRWHRKSVKATKTWLFGQAWRVVYFAQKVFQTSSKMSNPNAPGLGKSPSDKTAYIGKFGFIPDKSQIIMEMLSALYLGPNFPLVCF